MYLLLQIFFVFFTGICRGDEEKTVTPAPLMAEETRATEQKSALYGTYFKACLHQAKGQFGPARQLYQELMTRGASPSATKNYLQLLFDTQDFTKLIELSAKQFTDDLDIQLLRAQAFLHTGNNAAAEELFTKLHQKNPQNDQVVYQTIVCYLRSNKIDSALKALESYLKSAPASPRLALFYFLQSKIFLARGEPDKSLGAINKSLEFYPQFDQGLLFKSMLLEQMGRINEAIKGYTDFLDVVGNDAAIEKQLINMLFRQKRYADVAQRLETTAHAEPEHYFDLGLAYWQEKKKDPALSAVSRALELKPTFKKAWLLKIEICLGDKNKTAVLDCFGDWLKLYPAETEALEALMLLHQQHLTSADIISCLEAVTKNTRSSSQILGVLSDMYIETKQFPKALTALGQMQKLTLNSKIHSQLFFQQGYVYCMMNKPKEAERMLHKALATEPVFTSAYNLLAYNYAQAGTQLDKALGYINQALKVAPHNPTFLDTKACILMKMNKKEDAQILLRQALARAPEDSIITKRINQQQ